MEDWVDLSNGRTWTICFETPDGVDEIPRLFVKQYADQDALEALILAALVAVSLSEVTCRPDRTEPRPLAGGRGRDKEPALTFDSYFCFLRSITSANQRLPRSGRLGRRPPQAAGAGGPFVIRRRPLRTARSTDGGDGWCERYHNKHTARR